MKCPKCGAETRPNAKFCQVCGARLDQIAAPPATTEQTQPASVKEAGATAPPEQSDVATMPVAEKSTAESQPFESGAVVPQEPDAEQDGYVSDEPVMPPPPGSSEIPPATIAEAELAAGTVGEQPVMEAESVIEQQPATEPPTEPVEPVEEAAPAVTANNEDTSPIAVPVQKESGAKVAPHYKVLEVLDPTPEGVRRYVVADEEPWRHCWSCGSTRNEADTVYCDDCGAVLNQQRYILFEACPPVKGSVLDIFEQLCAIPNEVEQPGLLKVYDVYENEGCRYVLTERPVGDGPQALKAALPVAEDMAMEWTLQLGNILEFLEQYRIFLPTLSIDNIMRSGELIRLVTFAGGVYLPAEAPQTPNDLGEMIGTGINPAETHDLEKRQLVALAELMAQFAGYDVGQVPHPHPSPDALAEPVMRLLVAARNGTYQSLPDFLGGVNAALDELRFPPDILYEVGSASDVGRQRDHNEDGLLTLTLNRIMGTAAPPVGLFVVADGMGGHENGEVASQIALETVSADVLSSMILPLLRHDQFDAMSNVLEEAVQSANRRINAQRRSQGTDMGTTVTMALVIGSNVAVANAGDSRTYFVGADGTLEQISVDHSLVARLVAAGQITPEEIYTHPQRNQIYRSLGDKSEMPVDTFIRRLRPGEGLLLCSDGLWEMVHDPEMTQIIHESADVQEACNRLIDAANRNGGEDNISVILMRVHKREQDTK